MRAKALFPCVGDSADELSFGAGDTILEVQPAEDDGWFRGQLNGRVGIFPGNYVQFEEEEEEQAPPPALRPQLPGRNTISGAISGRSMSTGSSSGSQSSIASRAQTFGGIRRDMSAGSLSQMADGNSSDGFKVQLRPTPKPTDFAGTSSVTMDKDSNDSDTVARAKKMMNAHTTRIALMEKSNAIAKAGRESMTMRKTSASGNNLTEIPRAAPSPPLGSIANVMTRSASGSDLQNNSIAQLRSKFGALSTEDGDSRQAPNSLNGKPVVPNRPPILQSNQSYTPPRVPSRDSSPSQTRNATPTHPFRLPTQVTEHSPAEQEQEQLLKPSDLRKAQPAPFTAKPFELAHQSAPTLPTRRPNENTTGTALGLPKAVETNSTVVPTTTSKPPPRPVPTPPRPKPQVREDVRAVVEPLASTPNGTSKTIPPDALGRYSELFYQTDADNDGYLSGEETRRLWLRSQLDNRTLGLIWNLADVDGDSRLTREEFCIGMFLIDQRLGGEPVPSELPPGVLSSVKAATY